MDIFLCLGSKRNPIMSMHVNHNSRVPSTPMAVQESTCRFKFLKDLHQATYFDYDALLYYDKFVVIRCRIIYYFVHELTKVELLRNCYNKLELISKFVFISPLGVVKDSDINSYIISIALTGISTTFNNSHYIQKEKVIFFSVYFFELVIAF